MDNIYKAVRKCQRILALVWYCGIFAVYIVALIQALSLELTTVVGVVLVLWPFVLVASVQMARENIFSSMPVLRVRKIDGWGMLSFPREWRAEGENTLVFRNEENTLCAIACQKEQPQGEFTLNLPDDAPIRVKIPHNMLSEPETALRCRYTVGQSRAIGYCRAVQHMDTYLVAVVFSGNRMGKYIAEQFWSETCD